MPAETRRGGTYVMNHISFGRMMTSGQLRPALKAVAEQIKVRAAANSHASALGGDAADEDGQHLADSYYIGQGPIVVVKGQTGIPGPRISHRVLNPSRHAAPREFGVGRAKASVKGLRGGKRKRALQADVEGPPTAAHGTRDLRRAGEAFGDGFGNPA